MKKLFTIFLVLMTLGTFAYASPISQQWDKTFGGGGFDVATAMQQTMDGGYIIAGFTTAFVSYGAWVLKLDSNGNVIWEKTYGDDTEITSLHQTSDGGYVLTGYVFYVVETPPGQPKDIAVDILVLKLDVNGNVIWHKTYDGTGNEENPSVKQTNDGGYVVAAYTDTVAGDERNLWILRLDSTGNIVWEKTYGTSGKEGYHNSSEMSISIQVTSDGGYIIADHTAGDFWILRLDGNGNIIWNKVYGGVLGDAAFSIQQTSEGGYVVAGSTGSFGNMGDAWILKLDPSGDISWQKTYGGDDTDFTTSIEQTADGGYVSVGATASFGDESFNLWILRLSSSGNIIWQKVYSGEWSGNPLAQVMQTPDGGFIVSTNYSDPASMDWNFWVLKLDNNGEISDCQVMTTTDAIVSDTSISGQNISMTIEQTDATVDAPSLVTNETSADIAVICYYEDPDDMDGDGVSNTSSYFLAGSMFHTSFLADEDNCPDTPNGPFLGTCITGDTHKVGRLCIDDAFCGTGGFCSMNQETTNGNGIGDACYLCESDFDCDGDCDGTDAGTLKLDFGRSTFDNPCNNESQCHGDFDCDNDCDGTDASKFKEDFGRSGFNNPCPSCIQGDWCVYP